MVCLRKTEGSAADGLFSGFSFGAGRDFLNENIQCSVVSILQLH
jgi:hypothetical protein